MPKNENFKQKKIKIANTQKKFEKNKNNHKINHHYMILSYGVLVYNGFCIYILQLKNYTFIIT